MPLAFSEKGTPNVHTYSLWCNVCSCILGQKSRNNNNKSGIECMYATQLHDGNNNDSNNNNNGHRSQFLPTTPLYNFQQSPSYKANWFTFLIVHEYVCMYVCMRKTELTYTHVEYNNVKNKFTLGDAATCRPVSLWNYVLLKRNFLPRIEFCKKNN